MRICDFCGAENEPDELEKFSDGSCYSCGNNLSEKRFKKENSESQSSESGETSRTFQIIVYALLIPIGMLAALFLMYSTLMSLH